MRRAPILVFCRGIAPAWHYALTSRFDRRAHPVGQRYISPATWTTSCNHPSYISSCAGRAFCYGLTVPIPLMSHGLASPPDSRALVWLSSRFCSVVPNSVFFLNISGWSKDGLARKLNLTRVLPTHSTLGISLFLTVMARLTPVLPLGDWVPWLLSRSCAQDPPFSHRLRR